MSARLRSLSTSIRLIVGLGNPGRAYEDTRHNVGFVVVDALAQASGAAWKRERAFHGDVARFANGAAGEISLLKPRTFMNESGTSIGAFCRFHKVTPPQVLVVFDEINLPIGKPKLSISGSAGGHNGLASILQHFGDGFRRLRIGIGPRHPPEIDLKDYVLGKLTSEQQQTLSQNIPAYLEGIDLLLQRGLAPAMNRLNRRSSPDDRSNQEKL